MIKKLHYILFENKLSEIITLRHLGIYAAPPLSKDIADLSKLQHL
jgi:hypothetical protein